MHYSYAHLKPVAYSLLVLPPRDGVLAVLANFHRM